MVTYPLTFPTSIRLFRSRIELNFNRAIFEGVLTRKVSLQRHAGGTTDRWEGEFTTTPLTIAETRTLTAWILSLRGRVGTFKAYDPDKRLPSTFVAGKVTLDSGIVSWDSELFTWDNDSFPKVFVVDGANQQGNTLNIREAPASALVLKAGDYFMVENRLLICVENVNTDGAGKATITHQPRIKTAPADGAAVTTEQTFFIAKLTKQKLLWQSDNVQTIPMTLGFIEDLTL